ncbi:Mediator of RNA polymerase II transcription subunit 8 like protein [Verticillium longisporum]|nr:Mediator of RNA polymerase II transcription subunit 8 like protein [Verticillium longisporum]
MAYRQQTNALGLSDDETKALEQTRQRLYQLTNSIQSFKADVAKSNPLPPQSSLQAQYQILLRNLQSLLDIVNENAVPFAHTSVHPAVNFPGRTQENILLTLLRKKREPDVEERVERGLETARDVRAAVAADGKDGITRLEEVWKELRAWTQERVARYVIEEAGDRSQEAVGGAR